MGIFKSKEEKDEQKAQDMETWLNNLSLSDIDKDCFPQLKRIKHQLKTMYGYPLLSSKSDVPRDIYILLTGMVEQNWLLIKQNDQLRKQNEKIIELLKNK
ncbi:hypothetical protein OZX63_02780 [Lactobacillus sp. ESL0700]|nr:hypothetical protein [Lactobacillus sp. ESL0700]WEV51635.1 hypothetical protein OZX63_02780 [Lactobacillus sp. ESL0700]